MQSEKLHGNVQLFFAISHNFHFSHKLPVVFEKRMCYNFIIADIGDEVQ